MIQAQRISAARAIGGYAVDNEGVRAQRVTLVENGTLKSELMSRRPGRTPISPMDTAAPRS